MNEDECVDVIYIIHFRPNATMHISNGTSVINDEDDYGNQTVLHPSNETTVVKNM